MTRLGLYLMKRSVNKSAVARKTGISPSRISELTLSEKSHLRVKELELIARAIDVEPCDLLSAITNA